MDKEEFTEETFYNFINKYSGEYLRENFKTSESSNQLEMKDNMTSRISSYDSQADKSTDIIKELTDYKALVQQIECAVRLIRNKMLNEISAEASHEIIDALDNASDKYYEATNQLLDKMEKAKPVGNEGKTFAKDILLQNMFGFSDDVMLHFYTFGNSLFQKSDFSNAKIIFDFLVLLAPDIPQYWIASAKCCEKEGNFEIALSIYTFAANLFQNAPAIHFYKANCALELKNVELAAKELEIAEAQLKNKPDELRAWKPTLNYLKSTIKEVTL